MTAHGLTDPDVFGSDTPSVRKLLDDTENNAITWPFRTFKTLVL
jgi:hypothetical protein